MTPHRPSFLPSPAKLLLALPAVFSASSASAVIIYTDFGPSGVTAVPNNAATNLTFSLDGSYDLTGATSYNFSLFVKAANPSQIDINAASGSGTAVAQLAGVSFFGPGQTIGPDLENGLTFTHGASGDLDFDTFYYVGLEDNGNYGWAEVMVSSNANITLFGVAYDDSGASILTGDTGASAIPEPGVTAAFAGLVAGAVAALAARRKRKANASADVA